MNMPTEQELAEFANALQLSINTKVVSVACDGNMIKISFSQGPSPDDENLLSFIGIFEGEWSTDNTVFIIKNAEKINWPRITLFLLLTRMNSKNIAKLTCLDKTSREIAAKLGFGSARRSIDSTDTCSKLIFEQLEKKKMTIRELADATGLTQMTINNFKAGRDIRVSNLIKIANALGMEIFIK